MSGFWFWLIVASLLWIGVTVAIVRYVQPPLLRAALFWGLLFGTLLAIGEANDAFTAAGAQPVHIILFLGVLALNFVSFVNVIRCAVLMGLKSEAERKAAEAQSPPVAPPPLTEAQQANQWLGLIWYQAWDQSRRNRW